ncbi:MAG: T9SS type A sorting domain-containing protein [Bacteroidales bacterium]|nr:T9SS type A sorting domain-containing protein [Bacteroidales bacterium]
MKKLIVGFSLVLFVVIAFAQKTIDSPMIISKAAFFDKTPPLSEMEIILPGEQDRSWEGDEVKNESLEIDLQDKTMSVTNRATLQDYNGTRSTKGPMVNIEGVGNVNGVYPPDTDGDVGPNHYFQMINLSFAIYDKEGNKLYGPVANGTLWSGFPGPWAGTNDGDPIILYDEMADRWMASQFAIYTSNGKYYELIAISETGDPLGAWYRYAFEFDLFPDYPKLSVWPDGYYATFHMFGGGGFVGTGVAAFERDKMLVGDPDAEMIYFGQYSSKFGFLPSDVDVYPTSLWTLNYVRGINFGGNKNIEVWELHADWNNPNNSTFQLAHTLSPSAFSSNINGIPQPGTGNQLAAIASVMMFRLPFRDFGTYKTMVANHTVNASGRAGVRWYELRDDGSGWYIYQEGTYSPDSDHRWMGSIAMAANGNIAIGYSVSSSSTFPSIRYAGRTANAPLGEMNMQEIEIVSGGSSQSGIERWGDYSCISVDPADDSTFWYTTEYMKSAGWGTRIASFDFSAIEPPTAYAGADTTICENELFNANASATNYASVLWETSGDGQFQNPNILNAKYLRGTQDIENGSVTLILNVYGYLSGQEDSDEVVVTIDKEPVANAGPDFAINAGEVAQLDGSADDYDYVEWTSEGDGIFNDNTILDPEYTPGTGDIAAGQVQLTLMASSNYGCADDDKVKITINEITSIGESSEKDIRIVPNPTDGRFYVTVGSGDYSIIVRDILGEQILKEQFTASENGSIIFDISNNNPGLYFVEISDGKSKTVRKLVLR